MQALLVTPMPEPPLEEAVMGPSCTTELPSLSPRQGRRAATTMEYLVMLSFILLVVIVGIQSFGSSVANLFKVDVNATTQSP